jgi:hypothetical protein
MLIAAMNLPLLSGGAASRWWFTCAMQKASPSRLPGSYWESAHFCGGEPYPSF